MNIQGYSANLFSSGAFGVGGTQQVHAAKPFAPHNGNTPNGLAHGQWQGLGQVRKDPEQARQTFEAFGQTMAQRLEENAVRGEGAAEGSDTNLASALAETAQFLRDNFGDRVAGGFMHSLSKRIGDGAVGEEALGEAMLNTIRKIDQTFGVEAGDSVMAELNNNLNGAVNDFFDNGAQETLMTKEQFSQAISSNISALAGAVGEQFGGDAGESVMDIMLASLEDSEDLLDGYRTGLDKAAAYLSDQYGEAAASYLNELSSSSANTTQTAVSSSVSQPPSAAELVDGTQLDTNESGSVAQTSHVMGVAGYGTQTQQSLPSGMLINQQV